MPLLFTLPSIGQSLPCPALFLSTRKSVPPKCLPQFSGGQACWAWRSGAIARKGNHKRKGKHHDHIITKTSLHHLRARARRHAQTHRCNIHAQQRQGLQHRDRQATLHRFSEHTQSHRNQGGGRVSAPSFRIHPTQKGNHHASLYRK
jgi:hypothetical protein